MTARDHGSALTTLRWGDTATLVVQRKDVGDSSLELPTKQLVQAHWRWPLTWTVQFAMVPQLVAAETASFRVEVEYTAGCGQGQMTWTEDFVFAPSGGVYAPQAPQRTIPAQDLQIRASLSVAAGHITGTAGESFGVGCMVAPVTEPHAMTEVLGRLRGEEPDQVEWMGQFNPQALHYRR